MKRNVMKKILAACLSASMMAGYLPANVEDVQAEGVNVALNKPTATSSVRPQRAELVGGLAVDGVDDEEASRWSSKMATGKGENEGTSEDGTVEQWIVVDLEGVYDLSEIYLSWENAYASSYKIQVSTDNKTYTDIYTNADSDGGKQTIEEQQFSEDIPARYVKILCVEPFKASWGYSLYEIEVQGTRTDNENAALNKAVTYSGVEGGKVNGNWKYPQFVGEKAVDGDVTTRWSADKTDNQWLIVDLGEETSLSQVNVNFFREPSAYTVEISKDGETYETILDVKDNPNINIENIRKIPFETQDVRYIKVNQTEMFTNPSNNQKYGGSIYEIEAYPYADEPTAPKTAKSALSYVEEYGFELPAGDNEKVIFPEEITENFNVEIYGSDYKPVIAMDGTYHQPLNTKDVHVMYKVTSKENPEDVAVSTNDCTVQVPGKYPDAGEGETPKVIPALQEWYGQTGEFKLADNAKVVYKDETLAQKASLIATYITNMIGVDVTAEQGTNPKAGDIYLGLDESAKIAAIGEEGYQMEVGDAVSVISSTKEGAFYGGVTAVQALYLSKDTKTIQKGISRDYPKYEVRSIALDIARSEIQLDYIKEITEILPFFKINEIVMHINDDRGDKITDKNIGSENNQEQARDLSSFRIENEKGIGSHSYQISKEDYIQYQKDAKEYGVAVITELDTPAHSAVFSLLPEMKENMYDVRHLKISEDSSAPVEDVKLHQPTIDFIDGLTEELIGDGPGDAVIQSDVFHFGTDEYDTSANHSEAMQQYINHYVDFIQSRGYEARAWASTDGASGFKGYVTPQNKEVTYYLWAPYWADVKKTLANGNPIINCSGSWLYIVPGGNNNYHDYLNVEDLFENWSVNNITTTRGSGGAVIPISHPQLRGASVVLWNDDGFLEDGISDFDIYNRLKEGISIISERTWYGEKTEGQTYEDFKTRSDELVKKGPTSNPARYVESVDETIASYDFEDVDAQTVKDGSKNGYNGEMNNAVLVDGKAGNGKALGLEKDSTFTLPFDTVGFPASVSFDLYVEEESAKDAALFESEDGAFHLNQKNKAGDYTGKFGFERDGYTYTFDYEVPMDQWIHMTITTDKDGTRLFVNGRPQGYAERTEFGKYVKKDLSSSMVLPTAAIGNGVVGKLDNLTIYNEVVEIPGTENIAPTAASADASNVFNDNFTGEKAIDGNLSTRWATTNETNTATLELDFGKEVSINAARIVEYKAANNYINSYNIEYWDGQQWVCGFTHNVDASEKKAVSGVTNGYAFDSEFDTITAAKFRLNITDAKRPSVYELELYSYPEEETPDPAALSTAVLEYALQLAEDVSTDGVVSSVAEKYNAALANAKDILARVNEGDTSVTQQMIDNAWQELIKAMQYLSFRQGDKTDLEKVIAMADDMAGKLDSYLDGGKKAFGSALAKAKEVYADGNAMQEEVNTAWQNLLGAMAGMQMKPDKSALESLLKEALELQEKDYDTASFAQFRTVLADAQAVCDNEQATAKEVAKAEEDLAHAIAKLTPASGGSQNAGKEVAASAGGTDTKDGRGNDKSNTETAAVDNGAAKSAKTGDDTAVMTMMVLMAGAALVVMRRRKYLNK